MQGNGYISSKTFRISFSVARSSSQGITTRRPSLSPSRTGHSPDHPNPGLHLDQASRFQRLHRIPTYKRRSLGSFTATGRCRSLACALRKLLSRLLNLTSRLSSERTAKLFASRARCACGLYSRVIACMLNLTLDLNLSSAWLRNGSELQFRSSDV